MPDYSDTRIQFRRGTASEWSSENPTLSNGEPGFDSTNKIIKVGDGSSQWNDTGNLIASNTSGIAGASGVYNAVVISSGDYNALSSYDPNTIYYVF